MIARNTAFTYKGKAVDLKQIGRELNVRYVLEGSVQRGGNRMRVNVQLIDAETGNHLWAERFDKPLADLFDMQDEIVARLAGALNAQLVAAEARRAEQAPTPDSMDLYFQGWLGSTRARLRTMSRRREASSIALWPSIPTMSTRWLDRRRLDAREGASFFVTDPIAAFAAAEAKLTKALSSAPDHARGHRLLGYVDNNAPSARHRASPNANVRWSWIEILPAPMPLSDLASFSSVAPRRQRLTLARPCALVRAIPMAYTWKSFAGIAKNVVGSYEQAVAWSRRAIEANPNYPIAYFNLAAALAQLGRREEAYSAVKAGLALNPAFTVSRARTAWTAMLDDPAYLPQLEPLLQGMFKAGVPER